MTPTPDTLLDVRDLLTGLYFAGAFFGFLVVVGLLRAARNWGR